MADNKNEMISKMNINWDDMANAKIYSNHWKIRPFLFYHLSWFD